MVRHAATLVKYNHKNTLAKVNGAPIATDERSLLPVTMLSVYDVKTKIEFKIVVLVIPGRRLHHQTTDPENTVTVSPAFIPPAAGRTGGSVMENIPS